MAIGTPSAIWPIGAALVATANNTAATQKTTADAPAGSLICFFVTPNDFNNTITAFSDGTANSYTIVNSGLRVDTNTSCICYTYAKVDVPSGSSVTSNSTGASGYVMIDGFIVTGITNPPIDTNHTTTAAANTTLTVATGVLASTTEIVVANLWFSANPGAVTEGTGFTSFDKVITTVDVSYRKVTGTATVSWNPAWVNSVAQTAILLSFKAATATPRKNIIRITKRVF